MRTRNLLLALVIIVVGLAITAVRQGIAARWMRAMQDLAGDVLACLAPLWPSQPGPAARAGICAGVPEVPPSVVLARALRNDPPVGKPLGLPALPDLDGRLVRLPLDAPVTALLYFRTWERDSFDGDVKLLEDEAVAYPQVKTCVIVGGGDIQGLREKVRAQQYRSVFLCDEGGKVAKALNALVTAHINYIARFYMIRGDGILLYAENPLDADVKVIADARRIIERVLAARAQAEPSASRSMVQP